MQKDIIELHDIKPIVDVEDYSLYYFLGISFISVIIVVGAIYLFLKWFKNRKRYNKREEYLKNLKQLDLTDSKKSAYAITFYGGLFKDDGPRQSEMFKNITQRLENYKYKKEVEKFDDETLGYIELYREMIDV